MVMLLVKAVGTRIMGAVDLCLPLDEPASFAVAPEEVDVVAAAFF